MATSHTVEFAASHAAGASHPTAVRAPQANGRSRGRNRFVKLLADIVGAMREARELEIRMLGNDRFRRIGEA